MQDAVCSPCSGIVFAYHPTVANDERVASFACSIVVFLNACWPLWLASISNVFHSNLGWAADFTLAYDDQTWISCVTSPQGDLRDLEFSITIWLGMVQWNRYQKRSLKCIRAPSDVCHANKIDICILCLRTHQVRPSTPGPTLLTFSVHLQFVVTTGIVGTILKKFLWEYTSFC